LLSVSAKLQRNRKNAYEKLNIFSTILQIKTYLLVYVLK